VQCSVSFNPKEGTLRGMHYQADPHAEAKVVSCIRGAVFDVILDLRPTSTTYKQWTATELTAENRRSVYVPEGFAHGFQTVGPNSEIMYLISRPYRPEAQRGVRWDDPAFGIQWPDTPERTISERDRSLPDFQG
jgi:dTDP-4-dehydrorhamnose 3,5-epimerase